jgi:translocation and assembly module TamB
MTEAEPTNPIAQSKPPVRRRRTISVVAAIALVLLVLALAGLVTTTPGLHLLISAYGIVSGGTLAVDHASGRLTGPLHIGALRYNRPDLRVEAHDIDIDWTPAALAQGDLDIAGLDIGSLDMATRPTSTPPNLPSDLRLPVAVNISRSQVDRLRLLAWQDTPTATPLALLILDHLSGEFSSDGRHHSAKSLRLDTPIGALSGAIAIDGAAPFAIDSNARIEGRRDERAYAVEAKVAGRLDAIDIDANAVGKDFKGSAKIALTPFAPVPLRTAQIDIREIDPAAFVPGAPQATLRLQARLAPQLPVGTAAQVSPAVWVLGGTISIDNRTPGPLDRHALPFTQASADATWQDGELALENLRMFGAGPAPGKASGRLTLREQTLRGQLALAHIDPSTIFSTLKPARLAGNIDLLVRSDLQSIDARLSEPRWHGEVAAERHDGRINVRTLRLSAGKASLDASGSLEEVGHRHFTAKGRLKDFDPALYIASNKATLNAEVDASGTVAPLVADVSFLLHDSQLATHEGPRPIVGQGKLKLVADHLTQAHVHLDLAGNHVDVKGAWGQTVDVLQFSADAPRLDTLGFGLGGALTMTGELSGTFAHPVGHLSASATALHLPGGVVAARVEVKGQLGTGPDSAFAAQVVGNGITLGERGMAIENATLTLDGTRHAHALHGHIVTVDSGTMELAAHGALEEGWQWVGSLDQVDLRLPSGALTLAAAAPLAAAADHVTLGAAELRGESTHLQLQDTRWTPAGWQTRGSLAGLRVDLSAGPTILGKTTGNLTLGGAWDVQALDHIDGSLRLFREAGDVTLPGDRLLTLGLSDFEIAATAHRDRIETTLNATGERLGKMLGNATLLIEHVDGHWHLAQEAPLQVDAKADVPSLEWLGPLLNPNLAVGGHALAEIHVAGTLAKPKVRGSLQADAVSIVLIDQGLRLDDGSLRIDLMENRARLSAFSFRTEPRGQPPTGLRLADPALAKSPGRLSGSGELSLIDGNGEFRFDAEHLTILQRPDRWLMLSGTANLKTDRDALAVEGSLRADAGYFELATRSAPSLGDDVIVLGRGSKNADGSVLEKKPPFLVSVDLGVDLGQRLFFKGRGIDTRLAGELRLRADKAGALRASGSLRTHEGTFDAYGQSLAIKRGVLNFHGPIGQPSLNVLALRQGLAVEAGVEITGSVAAPTVRLISEPDVPDSEKLSWIVLGHGVDQAGADSGLLLSAAGAILGGPNGGGLPRRLANALGLDQISLTQGNPNATGSLLPATTVAGSTARSDNTSLTSQIVTLSKRLGDNAYLSYEQSLVGAVNVIKLTYNLSRRLSLVGRAGTDNSADLTYTFSFH